MAGDIPDGFLVEVSLGEQLLRVNVSIVMEVTGDGTYYMRWTGKMSGVVESASRGVRSLGSDGVAVFEQFVLVE